MNAKDKAGITFLLAVGLRVAYAFQGEKMMNPEVQACDNAKKMVDELDRRNLTLPDLN